MLSFGAKLFSSKTQSILFFSLDICLIYLLKVYSWSITPLFTKLLTYNDSDTWCCSTSSLLAFWSSLSVWSLAAWCKDSLYSILYSGSATKIIVIGKLTYLWKPGEKGLFFGCARSQHAFARLCRSYLCRRCHCCSCWGSILCEIFRLSYPWCPNA